SRRINQKERRTEWCALTARVRLTPVAADPYISATPWRPVSGNPDRVRPRRDDVAAAHPHVRSMAPAVVAGRPDITRPGRDHDHDQVAARRWRSNADHRLRRKSLYGHQ